MNHPTRVFSIKEIDSEDDLVETMANHKWPKWYGVIMDCCSALGYGPKHSPSRIMQIIKSITAREFFKKIPEHKKALWEANSVTMGDM